MQTTERPPLVLTSPEPEMRKEEEPAVEAKVEDKNQQNIFDLLFGKDNYSTVPMDY